MSAHLTFGNYIQKVRTMKIDLDESKGRPKFIDKWHFDRWAHRYDETVKVEDWMYRDYDKILDKVVEYADIQNSRVKVLDIGMGTGNLTLRFIRKGLSVIGIEPSEKMREIAQKKCPDLKIYDGHFLDIPLKEQTIDVIVSSFAFHHLTEEDKSQSIIEMKRVLKPGGKIVIADLMFKNKTEETSIKERLRNEGKNDIVEEIEDEYYGLFDELRKKFKQRKFTFKGEQLTKFVWIFCASLKR